MIYSYKDSYHGEQISPLFSLAGTLGIPNMYMKYTIWNMGPGPGLVTQFFY